MKCLSEYHITNPEKRYIDAIINMNYITLHLHLSIYTQTIASNIVRQHPAAKASQNYSNYSLKINISFI